MVSEVIEEFTINGREFVVLWKPGAAYLRADGHMWGGSLGEGLEQQEAVRLAKLRAEMMIAEERQREIEGIHQLYDPQWVRQSDNDYLPLVLDLKGRSFPVVWAPFNRNVYACTRFGWRFVGVAPDSEAALAAAQDCVKALPAVHRLPGQPELPPDWQPKINPKYEQMLAEQAAAKQRLLGLVPLIILAAILGLVFYK
ncbi:MAG: hypothetical protein ACM33T_16015 [Solirubrobacterales bacterium]